MVIYGVAVLALCTLAGTVLGQLLGRVLGIDANVGGVGLAMILLLAITSLPGGKSRLGVESAKGVGFWIAMYIPIVVAMAAKQNVAGALASGWVAIIAGLLPVLLGFLLLPLLSRFAEGKADA